MLLSSRAPHLHLLCVRGEDVGLIELRSVATIRGRGRVLLALQSYFYGIIELRSVATMLNNVTFRAQKNGQVLHEGVLKSSRDFTNRSACRHKSENHIRPALIQTKQISLLPGVGL